MTKFEKQLMLKKSGEDLQAYLQFQRRSSIVPSKKGTGSYSRKKKHKKKEG